MFKRECQIQFHSQKKGGPELLSCSIVALTEEAKRITEKGSEGWIYWEREGSPRHFVLTTHREPLPRHLSLSINAFIFFYWTPRKKRRPKVRTHLILILILGDKEESIGLVRLVQEHQAKERVPGGFLNRYFRGVQENFRVTY